jgi:cytochrome b561
MAAAATNDGYASAAKLLHWLVAACVIVLIPVAVAMVNASPGPRQDMLYNLHKGLGAVVLGLMAMRVGYRLMFGGPAPEKSLSAMQRFVSQAVHVALYALLIAMPVLGWAGTSAYGAPVPVFGLFELPKLVATEPSPNKDYAAFLFQIHKVLGFILAALVLLHISAALYHYFVRRDGVMQRMLP